jgi:hypothetical protein
VRIGIIALIGFTILICLIVMKQAQPVMPEKLMVGTIQKELGGDTGCWFRFPKANEDDPLVFFTDAPASQTLKGLANINNRDIDFSLIGESTENNSVYYSRSTQIYLLVTPGSKQIEAKNTECPNYPQATLTFSKNQNHITVPVKGECGCDNGLD